MLLLVFAYLSSLNRFGHTAGFNDFIKFEFIGFNYSTQQYSLGNLKDILNNTKFDRGKPTAIYNYGFTQTIEQPSVREVIDAYLENGGYNFILVNYNSVLAYTVYNAVEFGDSIATSLITLFDAGYGNFHLIGFSLGAQVAGQIGRSVIKQSNRKYIIPRISGLDPGQLTPIMKLVFTELNPNDATFVDTYHLETKLFASSNAVGTLSFWIGGGFNQPGCMTEFGLSATLCSHLQAPKIWASSVRSKNPKRFPAQRCKSYEDFKSLWCGLGQTTFMGLHADKFVTGRFYTDVFNLDPNGVP